jgi:hypothetical protein
MTTTLTLPITAYVASGCFTGCNPVVDSDTGPLGGTAVIPPGTAFELADDENAAAMVAKFGGQIIESG